MTAHPVALRAASGLRALLVAGLLAAGACSSDAGPPATGRLVFHTAAGPATLQVEMADSSGARSRGLMGRASLPADAGMAFLFPTPTEATFWMKDTLIPLSVAFWDGAGRVLAVVDMEPCREDPCRQYSAPRAYVGAAEANRGWFGSHGVEPGDRVELVRT